MTTLELTYVSLKYGIVDPDKNSFFIPFAHAQLVPC